MRLELGGARWAASRPVGCASLSGSNSSRVIHVRLVRVGGSGGGGDRECLLGRRRCLPGALPGNWSLWGIGGGLSWGCCWARKRDSASLPPLSVLMCFSPCQAGAHWTVHSWSGTGLAVEAGGQVGQVQTGTDAICSGAGAWGRQWACHQLLQRSHWYRGGPSCWSPAPRRQPLHGSSMSSSSRIGSLTRGRIVTVVGVKPARRCFWISSQGHVSGAQCTRYRLT